MPTIPRSPRSTGCGPGCDRAATASLALRACGGRVAERVLVTVAHGSPGPGRAPTLVAGNVAGPPHDRSTVRGHRRRIAMLSTSRAGRIRAAALAAICLVLA